MVSTRCRPGKCAGRVSLGPGVMKNLSEGARWLRASAEQGHITAQFHLGIACAEGKGVPRNFAQASKWFGKAANAGLAKAQTSLALLYANGEGVPQDYAQA